MWLALGKCRGTEDRVAQPSGRTREKKRGGHVDWNAGGWLVASRIACVGTGGGGGLAIGDGVISWKADLVFPAWVAVA